MLGNLTYVFMVEEKKNTLRPMSMREGGESRHFPVMTDVLFSDNQDSGIGELVSVAMISPRGQELWDRGMLMTCPVEAVKADLDPLLPDSI